MEREGMETMQTEPIGPHIGDIVGYVEPRAAGTLSWLLVHCVGKSDGYIAQVLKRAAIEDYYPMVREFRAVPRKQLSQKQRASGIVVKRLTLVPMLPRYRLLHVDPKRSDLDVVFTHAGIGGLVCHENLPVIVSDDFVAKLRSKEHEGAIPGSMNARLVFGIGETVRVTDGPFAGFNAIVEKRIDCPIEELDPETRIKVAVQIFARATPVELTVAQVEKL